jgi:FAD/FMN-containing dehydrogenase
MTVTTNDPALERSSLVKRLVAELGQANVLTEPRDLEAHVVDWRGRTRGKTFALLRPANVQEVAAIVRICAETRTAIVPQGGNTGQCAGAIPSSDGSQVIVSLSRLNRIIATDVENNTVTVEAGCVLATVQQHAAAIDRLFPLSLGAEGSCQIGGNLSTNAGGTAVLRYGNAREMVLGLEVVLPNGEIWSGLRGLRKDNSGYDLKQLFLGAEGTLGIITAAVLKLYPLPKSSAAALMAVPSPRAAVELMNRFRLTCGDRLTGFEIISRLCFDLLFKHIPKYADPLATRYDWYVLCEVTDPTADADLRRVLEDTLMSAIDAGVVLDAVIAASEAQAATLWQMRDDIPEGNRKEGPWVRHDVAVPVSRIPELIEQGTAALCARFPGMRVVAFGHIGDGNIHFNATAPANAPSDGLVASQDEIFGIVHALVMRLNGSFSAEHGIGLLKVDEVRRYKSAVELDLMRRIKHAVDPQGIMNPGKVLPSATA